LHTISITVSYQENSKVTIGCAANHEKENMYDVCN